jgi:predicted enzyme related to lactoylglutathione lyase
MSTGRIVWHELLTNDVERAKGFYADLLGWTYETWKPGEVDYTMVTVDGKQHGGILSLDRIAPGAPPHWLAYVAVDDLDGVVSRAAAGGGKALAGPMDIPEVGRLAVRADGQGAAIAAIQPSGEGPSPEGVFVWDELTTTDVDAAKRFYGDVFGWRSADADMGTGPYTLFKHGGDADAAGLMRTPDRDPSPPHWMTYVATPDVDATAARAGEAGGALYVPGMDIPKVGRFAVLADPTGAVFGIFAGGPQ